MRGAGKGQGKAVRHTISANCRMTRRTVCGIITSKLPLTRLRVCAAHTPVLAHRALRTLNPAKPQ